MPDRFTVFMMVTFYSLYILLYSGDYLHSNYHWQSSSCDDNKSLYILRKPITVVKLNFAIDVLLILVTIGVDCSDYCVCVGSNASQYKIVRTYFGISQDRET